MEHSGIISNPASITNKLQGEIEKKTRDHKDYRISSNCFIAKGQRYIYIERHNNHSSHSMVACP